MMFQRASGELKSYEPKDVATSIFNFFLYQYTEAVKVENIAHREFETARLTNKAVEREFRENGFGWGPELPHSAEELANREKRAVEARRQAEEARVYLNFVRDRLVDGFVECSEQSKETNDGRLR